MPSKSLVFLLLILELPCTYLLNFMLHVFQELYKAYTQHEKKYGDRGGIEDVIVSKRKFQYEEVCQTH